MGRPRGFEDSAALEDILQAFWRLGFHRASIDDLVAATGLNRASLYNAFGDKERMYELALARYVETRAAPWIRAASEPARLLRALAAVAAADPERRGCFLVNTAVERAPHHGPSRAEARRHFERLAQAVSGGSAADGTGPDGAAWALVASLLGLLVLAKAGIGREILAGAGEAASEVIKRTV